VLALAREYCITQTYVYPLIKRYRYRLVGVAWIFIHPY
jgi:hypothetical protein